MEQCFPAFSSVVHFALAVFTAWEFGWTVICGLKPAATRCHRVRGEHMMVVIAIEVMPRMRPVGLLWAAFVANCSVLLIGVFPCFARECGLST